MEKRSAVQFALPVPSQICQNPCLMSEGQATTHIYSLGEQARFSEAGKVDDSAGKGTGDLMLTKARLTWFISLLHLLGYSRAHRRRMRQED